MKELNQTDILSSLIIIALVYLIYMEIVKNKEMFENNTKSKRECSQVAINESYMNYIFGLKFFQRP